MKKERLPRSEM